MATEFEFELTNNQRLAEAADRLAGFGHNLKVFETENERPNENETETQRSMGKS